MDVYYRFMIEVKDDVFYVFIGIEGGGGGGIFKFFIVY